MSRSWPRSGRGSVRALQQGPEDVEHGDVVDLRLLWDATDVYRSVYFSGVTNRQRVKHEHKTLLTALRAGDVEAAVRAQHDHRDNSVTAVTAALKRA